MSRLILDTSALSAVFRGHQEAGEAVKRTSELWVSPVVVGEIIAGSLKTGGKHETALNEFLKSPRVRSAVVGEETGRRYAVIFDALRRAGTPVPTNDIWIAATAMEHGLTVLTLDQHFNRIPQVVCRLLTSPR